MKRYIGLIVAACFAIGFIASCIDDLDDPLPTLEFAEDIHTADVTGLRDSIVSITVLSNTRWRIDTTDNMLHRDMITDYYIGTSGQTAGSGEAILYFTVAENRYPDGQGVFKPRTTAVTIFTDDLYAEKVTRTLTVNQGAGAYHILLDPPASSVGAAQGQVKVKYDINGEWTVSTSGGVEVVSYSDSEIGDMVLKYPENTSAQERELIVKFVMTTSPSVTAEFKIIQAPPAAEP